MYNYLAYAHPPTSVNVVDTGYFVSSSELNVAIAKNNQIDLMSITTDGLQLIRTFTIRGKVELLKFFRTEGMDKDRLFVVTARHQVMILETDDSMPPEILTVANGNVSDAIGRRADTGILAVVEPRGRMIGLRLYDLLFKVIPLDQLKPTFTAASKDNKSSVTRSSSDVVSGNKEGDVGSTRNVVKELEAYDIRIEEIEVFDIQFLHVTNSSNPLVAILHQDNNGRHIKAHEVSNKQFLKVAWKQDNVEREASIIIPVSQPVHGCIIVGSESIVYHNGVYYQAIAPRKMQASTIVSWCRIDASRYLLGDMSGNLYLLVLVLAEKTSGSTSISVPHGGLNSLSFPSTRNSPHLFNLTPKPHHGSTASSVNVIVKDMKLELLGETTIPESMRYLDNGFVYIGSRLGDSQMIKLRSEVDVSTGWHLTVVDTHTNLGPIVDMTLVDIDDQGQNQLVTCSGAFKEGSVRIIRSGIGVNELARFDLPRITGIWSSKEKNGLFNDFIILSLCDETLVFKVKNADSISNEDDFESPPKRNFSALCEGGSDDDEFEELGLEGMCSEKETLFCGNVNDGKIDDHNEMGEKEGEGGRRARRSPNTTSTDHYLLQCTSVSLRLLDLNCNGKLLDEWSPSQVSSCKEEGKSKEGDDKMKDFSDDVKIIRPTIDMCDALESHVIVICGPSIHYLSIQSGKIVLTKELILDFEISCVSVSSVSFPQKENNQSFTKSFLCSVGLWSVYSFVVFHLPNLVEVSRHKLGREFTPKSIMLTQFGSTNHKKVEDDMGSDGSGTHQTIGYLYLLCTTVDGTLHSYNVDVNLALKRFARNDDSSVNQKQRDAKEKSTEVRSDVDSPASFSTYPPLISSESHKRVALGTQPLKLTQIVNTDDFTSSYVFASSDTPVLIHLNNTSSGIKYNSNSSQSVSSHQNAKLQFSNVNMKQVKHVCHLTTRKTYSNCLILATDQGFTIGKIDDIQKLHIRSLKLGETPTRLAYQKETKTFGVTSMRHDFQTHDGPIPTRVSVSTIAPSFSSSASTSTNGSGGTTASNLPSTSIQQPNEDNMGESTTVENNPSADSCRVSSGLLSSGGSGNGTGSNNTSLTGHWSGGGEYEVHSLLILDQSTMEVLHAHQFMRNEDALSLVSAKLGSDPNPYYIVGTAMVNAEESDPKLGRIVIFQWIPNSASVPSDRTVTVGNGAGRIGSKGGRLVQVAEKMVRGGCFALAAHFSGGKLVSAVNNSIRLWEWTEKKELRIETTAIISHVLSLYLKTCGDFILVGDLVRSMALLQYKSMESSLEEVCRDHSPKWMTAVEFLNDSSSCGGQSFVGADNANNIFVTTRDNSAIDEDRVQMIESSSIHIGDFINVFRAGTLNSKLSGSITSSSSNNPMEDSSPGSSPRRFVNPDNPMDYSDNPSSSCSSILFGTVHGAIGVFATIPKSTHTLLYHLQKSMAKLVPCVGKIDHAEYRSYACATQHATLVKTHYARIDDSDSDVNNSGNVILDGELIEMFVDLDRDTMREIVCHMVDSDYGRSGSSSIDNEFEYQDPIRISSALNVAGMLTRSQLEECGLSNVFDNDKTEPTTANTNDEMCDTSASKPKQDNNESFDMLLKSTASGMKRSSGTTKSPGDCCESSRKPGGINIEALIDALISKIEDVSRLH